MIDSGFRTLKLILIGLIIIVAPILLIMQSGEINKKEMEKEDLKDKLQKLELDNKQLNHDLKEKVATCQIQIDNKDEIIRFYSDVLHAKKIDTLKRNIVITSYDTIRKYIFDKAFNKLIIEYNNSYFDGRFAQNIPINLSDVKYIRSLCEKHLRQQDSFLEK